MDSEKTNATGMAVDEFRRVCLAMRDEARKMHGPGSGYWSCYHTCEHFGLDGGVMVCNHPDAPHRMIINHTELEKGWPESCPSSPRK
ncbi:MAG: hypothetical protein GTN69_02440 [Armatimonadetes bacterium]|nr:hypothetical protein [Armatimonadota bacterium]